MLLKFLFINQFGIMSRKTIILHLLFCFMLTAICSPPILPGASEKRIFFSTTDLNRNFSLKLGDATIHTVKRTLSDTYFLGLPEEGVQKSPKRFTRALLFNSGLILISSINYWIKYTKWIEDWQYELTWEDQKIRFFSLEAHRFDSNPFFTNWTHALSGAGYYNIARYHRLNKLESLLFMFGSSLFWEYFTEWREVISINDTIFSGIGGGLSVGEPLYQIGSYFTQKGGVLNKILGFFFNPIVALNELLDKEKNKSRIKRTELCKPHFDLYFGQKQVSFKGYENSSSQLFNIGMETRFYTIPGYREPGTINKFIKDTLLSEFFVDLTFGANTCEEHSIFTRAVVFGHFIQKIKQDSYKNLKGYSFFAGAGSAFDFFKKRAIAYYDQFEYHFDFTGGEEAPQPTEFTDKLAILNLIGPVFELSIYSGQFEFRSSISAYIDFALLNSLALNEYSINNDLYEPQMKTTLSHYGYYYAFGFTFSSDMDLNYKNIQLKGKIKYQYYNSIEGLDRFQDDVEDDCNVRDTRFMYKISLGYALSKSPVTIQLAYEHIDREGKLKDITHSTIEDRIYTRLQISF